MFFRNVRVSVDVASPYMCIVFKMLTCDKNMTERNVHLAVTENAAAILDYNNKTLKSQQHKMYKMKISLEVENKSRLLYQMTQKV